MPLNMTILEAPNFLEARCGRTARTPSGPALALPVGDEHSPSPSMATWHGVRRKIRSSSGGWSRNGRKREACARTRRAMLCREGRAGDRLGPPGTGNDLTDSHPGPSAVSMPRHA